VTTSRRNAAARSKVTQSAVDWFSAGAATFDRQYRGSTHFSERVAVWNALIREWCPPGGRVLDAGCGSGVLAAACAQTAGEVVAAEPSREMLDICARRCDSLGITNCVRIQCRIEELGSAGLGQFDLSLCSSVLEYVDSLPTCLAVFCELLRPNGTLIASLPNPASGRRAVERLSYGVLRRPRYFGFVRNAPSTDEMDALLSASGFALLDTHYVGVPRTLRRPSRLPFVARRVATMIVYVARRL
jgi:2-polyprenyl-3-methyl-5-hydroxy-6-metoxy-1,4-benzoquinol methylase